jgi:succinate dehydrogenase/fumarate reductase iron-sulfur protein
MSNISVSIQKYDPSKDEQPYFVTYEVPWKENLTALEAIHYINENCEPIVFDYSCRGGLCGRCSCMVDDKAGLACFTPLTEEAHTIAPLKGFPVIRDLVVDKESFQTSFSKLNLGVMTSRSTATEDLPNIDYDFWYDTMFHLDMCRECGNCLTVCPIYQQNPTTFAGPAALSQLALRMYDNLDQADRALQAYTLGIHDCIKCGLCEAVCPARIKHASLHEMMQNTCTEKGYEKK